MMLDISWTYPCVCLTGSQFWRSSHKILVAKKSERAILRKGKGKINTHPVSTSSERPIETSLGRNSPEEEVAKVLKSIFKCSTSLNTVCLPAAACACCYTVMGCIPCVEQWHASSANASQCP